jgi:hypothetical protein
MRWKSLSILLLVNLLIWQSCYKDEVYQDDVVITQIEHPENPGSGTIIGIIRDENGNKMDKVSGELPGLQFSTGKEGVLIYEIDGLDQKGTPIQLSTDKVGLTSNLIFLDGEVNYFHKTLITHPDTYVFNADEGLTVDGSDVILTLPAGGYQQNGQLYSNEVHASVFMADLDDPIHLQAIPGNRMAINDENATCWLDYQKVFFLYLDDENGHTLELAQPGFASSTLDDCPNCALWRFDEENHRWKMEISPGTFNPEAAQIRAIGIYAVAAAYPFQNTYGQLKVEDHPLAHFGVDIWQNGHLITRVYTTNQGKWVCPLPIEQDFEYRISLDQSMSTFAFRTTSNETQLPTRTLSSGEWAVFNIAGKTKNCQHEKIDEFFCFVSQDNKHTPYFLKDSHDNFVVPNYGKADPAVFTTDRNLEEFSPTIQHDASIPEIGLDTYYNCNAYREGYFQLNIDGQERTFTVMESRLENGRTKLIVYDEINLTSEFKIYFKGSEARFYQDEELNILFDRVEIGDQSYEIRCENSETGCGFDVFQISHYGKQKGDWIQGNFSGEFWVKSSLPNQVSYKLISGQFLVPRTFS